MPADGPPAPEPEPEPAAPRKRLTAEARRQMILDAARDVFLEKGLNGARLRDIAERVGITEAYLYRHFASKTDLYEAAVHEPVRLATETFTARLEELVGTEGLTGLELVRRINEIMLRFMLEAVPYLGVALFSDTGSGGEFYQSKIYPRVHEPVRFLLRSIQGWPAPGIDPDLVVNSMWGLNYGVALDALLRGGTVDVTRTAERVTRLYAVGIPEFKKAKASR
ncbi:MAG TPA: TetR/AcrR family transcriptional regulator [Acidimicrobiia bacterium]|nr:TetR/AcrR family transcriptional regulator [Acidimicrobiia bacterium]